MKKRKRPREPNTPFTFKALYESLVKLNYDQAFYIPSMLELLENEEQFLQEIRNDYKNRLENDVSTWSNKDLTADFIGELRLHQNSSNYLFTFLAAFDRLDFIPDKGCKDWSEKKGYEPHQYSQVGFFKYLYNKIMDKYAPEKKESSIWPLESTQGHHRIYAETKIKSEKKKKQLASINATLVGRIIVLMQEEKLLPSWSAREAIPIFHDLTGTSEYLRKYLNHKEKLTNEEKEIVVNSLKAIIGRIETE